MLRLSRTYDKFQVEGGKEKGKMKEEDRPAIAMTEQNRRYVTNEIAPVRDLADQGAGGAGVRAEAPHHQEAGQHA